MVAILKFRPALLAVVLAAAFGLSACAGGSAPVARAPVATATPAPSTPAATLRPSPATTERGLGEIIGAQAASLTARLGTARIDLREGEARKLQFAGEGCVLDIYLYPLVTGAEPVATHVEARQRRDGRELDPARCLTEIERR